MRTLKRIFGVVLWPLQFVFVNLWAVVLLRRTSAMQAIQKRQRFVVSKEFQTTAVRHWRAPYTDGFPCTLSKGTILVVASESPPTKAVFVCVPEDREAFVMRHVPEDIRQDPKFNGISFVIEKKNIGIYLSCI